MKERRAFEVKSVQPDLPGLGLRLNNYAPIDYTSTIEGEAAHTSVFLNPQIFKDMANVSDSIHTYRRGKIALEAQEETYERDNDAELELFQNELDAKYRLGSQASKINSAYLADILTAKQKAATAGQDFMPILKRMNEEQKKAGDDLYTKSPYLAGLVENYRESVYTSNIPGAFEQDQKLAQFRINQDFERDVAINSQDLLYNGTPLDEVMRRVAENTLPNLANLPEDQKEVLFNTKAYQPLFGVYVEGLKLKVGQGLQSLKEAQEEFELFAATYSSMDFSVPDGTGKEQVVKCYLSPDQVNTWRAELAKMDNSTNLANPYLSAEEYYTYTGKEFFDKGDWLNNTYLLDITSERAQQDFLAQLSRLEGSVNKDTPAVIKQINDLKNYYSLTVAPAVAVVELLRMSQNERGNGVSAAQDLISRANRLDELIKDIKNGGDIPATIEPLMIGNGSTSLVYLGPPRGLTLGTFNPRDSFLNVLNEISSTFRKAGTDHRLPSLISMFNSKVRNSYKGYVSALTPNLLVLTDSTTDEAKVNKVAVMQAIEKGNVYNKNLEAACGTSFTSTIDSNTVHALNSYTKGLGNREYSTYVKGVSEVVHGSQQSESWLRTYGRALADEDKNFYYNVSTGIVLGVTKEGQSYIRSIEQMRDADESIDLSTEALQSKLNSPEYIDRITGMETDTFAGDVDFLLNKYNVPPGMQGAMRYAIAQASYAYLRKHPEEEWSFEQMEQIVSSNFTESGIYKYSKTLKNTTPERLEKEIKDTKETLKVTSKNLKLPDGYDVTYDSLTGNYLLKFNDGVIWGKGTYGPLEGSGEVPFVIYSSSLPFGISDEERQSMISTMIVGANVLASLSVVEYSEETVRELSKAGLSLEDMEALRTRCIQMLNTLGTPEGQAAMFSFLQSGGRSLNFEETLPANLERALIGSVTKKSISAGDHFRSSPIVRYILWHIHPLLGAANEAAIYQGMKKGKGKTSPEESEALKAMSLFYNALYSKTTTANKLDTTVPAELYSILNDPASSSERTPIQDFMALTGGTMTITSTYQSEPGTHTTYSYHDKAQSIDVGCAKGNAFFSDVHGIVKPTMRKYIKAYAEAETKSGRVRQILTSDRTLVSDMKYLKNKFGEPVFNYEDDHTDHFHIDFYQPTHDINTNKEVRSNPKYRAAMSDYLMTQSRKANTRGALSIVEATSIVDNYSSFGYKATEFDSKITGISLGTLKKDPILRQLAIAERYKLARNVFGSTELAILALEPTVKFKVSVVDYKGHVTDVKSRILTFEEVVEYKKTLSKQNRTIRATAYAKDNDERKKQNNRIMRFKQISREKTK